MHRSTFIAAAIILSLGIVATLCGATSSKTTFSSDGVYRLDGKALFPIGVTMPPPPGGRTPRGTPAFAELRDGGIQFIRTGPSEGSWDDAAISREQTFEDAAAQYQMHCLCWLKELATVKPGDTAREAKLRTVIERFKNHPGLAMWKGADEPEWGKMPIPPLANVRQIVHQLDPNHPVWIVQAPRGTVESRARYDSAYDVTGLDIYPISYPPGTHSLEANKEISMVGDYTREMMAVAGGKKPVWMTLQIAWSGVTKTGKTLRFPTFPQERFMTYQAIINGARGLVYFGGHILADCSPADAQLGWNWTFWDRVLHPVLEEINDKSPLAPALVAPNAKLPIQISGANDIEFCVREVGSDLFLLACKREGQTVKVTFSGLPVTANTGEVLYESPRQVAVEQGQMTDWFAPFDVHVYRFRR